MMAKDSVTIALKKREVINTPKKSKSKNLDKRAVVLFVILIGMFFVGGVAAAYVQIVENNPNNIWESALVNTSNKSKDLEAAVEENESSGGKFSGQIDVSSPVQISGTIDGQWLGNDLIAESKVDVANFAIESELRSVYDSEISKNSTYIKFDGLDSLSLILGLLQPEVVPFIGEVNNNWYELDQSNYSEELQEEDFADKLKDINPETIQKLFNIDNNQLTISSREYIGKEEINGKEAYKYLVTIEKSQLEQLLVQIDGLLGSLDSALPSDDDQVQGLLDDLNQQYESLDKEKLALEVWIDKDTKIFNNIRFDISQIDSENQGLIDFGIVYEGVDEYPFYIKVDLKNTLSDENILLDLGLQYNANNGYVDLSLGIVSSSEGQEIEVKGQLSIIPSNDDLEVQAPENPKSIQELVDIVSKINLDGETSPVDSFDPSAYIFDDVELR